MPNLPTPEQVQADPRIVAKLDLATLKAIVETCDERAAVLTFAKRAINNAIAERLNDDITAAYLAKGVDTGVVHIDRDGLDVVVDRSKTVAWDQAQLAKIAAEMTKAGDDPSEYVKVAYSVSEAAYNAWPTMIRRVFEPARTVRPGNASIKLVEPKAEAA